MSAVYGRPNTSVPPVQVLFEYVYYVPKWKSHQNGYMFEISLGGITRVREYHSLSELYGNNLVPIPFDPITAISLGLVTPEEINLPEGLRAAFNLLK